MVVRRESAFPLGFDNSHSTDDTPVHIANTIVEDLLVGDYLIKYRIRPVVFFRIANWSEDLSVLKFDPGSSGNIILSDDRVITLTNEELEYYFNDVDLCRIVLVGDEGYSSFKIEFE